MARQKRGTDESKKSKTRVEDSGKSPSPWTVTIVGGIIATILALPGIWIWNLLTTPNPLAGIAGTYEVPSFAIEQGSTFYGRNKQLGPFPREMLTSIRVVLDSNGSGKFNIDGVEAAVKYRVSGDTLTLELENPAGAAKDLESREIGAGTQGGGMKTTEELRLSPGRKRIFFPINFETVSANGKSSLDKRWFPWAYVEKQ